MAAKEKKGKGQEAAGEETLDFEADLKQLEDAVERLESGAMSLDESLKLYEKGIGAYRRCHKALQDAELKIKTLVETLEGELREEPFEAPEEES